MTRFSRIWFTVAFSLSYIPIFAQDWPLFIYYPVSGRAHFNAVAEEPGPAMHWYGFLASAAIVGVIAGAAGRDRWIPKAALPWLWVAPLAAMGGSFILLRKFFL